MRSQTGSQDAALSLIFRKLRPSTPRHEGELALQRGTRACAGRVVDREPCPDLQTRSLDEPLDLRGNEEVAHRRKRASRDIPVETGVAAALVGEHGIDENSHEDPAPAVG